MVNRRRFLAGSGLILAWLGLPSRARAQAAFNWFDPNGWPELGHVPSAADTAVIPAGRTIVLTGVGAAVGKLTIQNGGTLQIAPNPGLGVTLDVFRNLIVDGLLSIPAAGGGNVTVTFHANDAGFVGGGMTPLDTDCGLWVTDNGQLNIQGVPKLGWTRATAALTAGIVSIPLADVPIGWKIGDQVVVTPTEPPTVPGFAARFDLATISGISGNTVTLSAGLQYPHPAVPLPNGTVAYAEVLNLTRNVVLQGTPANASHVFVRSRLAQTLQYGACRNMGIARVLGRYPLHFHHGDDFGALPPSTVTNWVVQDSGNHAFVPHMTSGVQFAGCVAHRVQNEAYWWDEGDKTNNTVWDRCVAANVSAPPPGYRLAGFVLGAGVGNVVRSCVACGIQGGRNAAGYEWPEHGLGVWDSHDDVAHNCAHDGIFVWQNDSLNHLVRNFTLYNCGSFGIEHGAYLNVYVYDGLVLSLCAASVNEYAQSKGGFAQTLTYRNSLLDGNGRVLDGISFQHHTAPAGVPLQIVAVAFRGFTRAAVSVVDDPAGSPTIADVRDPVLNGVNALWFGPACNPGAVVRITGTDPGIPAGGPWEARPASHGGGTFYAPWNARIRAIPGF